MTSAGKELVSIALAGDVMIGRGIDQIMRHPGDPIIHETWARSALRYVELAEDRSGSLPRRVDPGYVWGDVVRRLSREAVDVRIVNLETALTGRGRPWPSKGIHYRAHPANASCLSAAGIDVAVVANNHILDWSEPGLEDTLDTLDRLGVGRTGAGRDAREAWAPASVITEGVARVLVLGVGSPSSGIDPAWEAGTDRPGVAVVGSLSDASLEKVARALDPVRRPGDIIVVSIHWGPNWGYGVPSSHRRFARELVDHIGVDVVHGHSSHHPMGFEVYKGSLVLYGCGDLLTDYEGIGGHDEYRADLGGWYVVSFDGSGDGIGDLRIFPTKVHRFQLTTPDREEMYWLADMFQEHCLTPGAQVRVADDVLTVGW